ncbi:hypothetical protein V6C42_12145 [Pseudoclostridium thermosuccinogenes]|uniref:hypothetical protein n=1 Tax=Clostridium thermosuccinogenes TaxID=84032 RepID=UPI002FD9893F
MHNNYKRTFDTVKMSKTRQEQIRSELSSYLSKEHREHNLANQKRYSFKKPQILAIAAITVLALSLVGFKLFEKEVIQLFGGGQIEQGVTSEGEGYVKISGPSIDMADAVRIENDQIYFILDGSNKNITYQCSESTYYEYERTDDNGYRHIVIIGGTADSIGIAEFVWDKSGRQIGSTATYGSDEMPMWLKSAMEKYQWN